VVDIYLEYEGDLHCRAEHGPSHSVLVTDAPVDNQGRGQAFSPTDLVATALGTCMATTMGIVAKKHGYAIDGTRVHVKKLMSAAPPRRIAKLAVEIAFSPSSTTRDAAVRAELEKAAHNCPVRISLADSVEVPVVFQWQE